MNATLKNMLSARFVIGFSQQRLNYLAEQISESRAEYCIVLNHHEQRYLGLFRLVDVASTCGSSVLVIRDLLNKDIAAVAPPDTSPAAINSLLRTRHSAVVLVDDRSVFYGLITLQSYAAWALREERLRPGVLPIHSHLDLSFGPENRDWDMRQDA